MRYTTLHLAFHVWLHCYLNILSTHSLGMFLKCNYRATVNDVQAWPLGTRASRIKMHCEINIIELLSIQIYRDTADGPYVVTGISVSMFFFVFFFLSNLFHKLKTCVFVMFSVMLRNTMLPYHKNTCVRTWVAKKYYTNQGIRATATVIPITQQCNPYLRINALVAALVICS